MSSFTVLNTKDSGDGSLRAIIKSASPGDQISFSSNTNNTTLNLTSAPLEIDKDLTITGSENLFLNGDSKFIIFKVGSNINLLVKDITFTYGLPACYLNTGSSVTFENCNFKLNSSSSVSSVIHGTHNNNVELTNCIVSDNEITNSNSGHSIISLGNQSTLRMLKCEFSNNTTQVNSPINLINADLVIEESNFIDNESLRGEGGVLKYTGNDIQHLDIIKSIFKDNKSHSKGGAIFISSQSSSLNIDNSHFQGNIALENINNLKSYGGALYINNSGSSFIKGSTFNNNTSRTQGGALWLSYISGLSSVNNTFVNNDCISTNEPVTSSNRGLGGAMFLEGNISSRDITHCTIAYNHAGYKGGAVHGGGGLCSSLNTIYAFNTVDNTDGVNSTSSTMFQDKGGNLQYPDKTNSPQDLYVTNNITIKDPLLTALVTSDYWIPYLSLRPNSPCIKNGNTVNNIPPVDKRGVPRNASRGVDIGSIELAPVIKISESNTILSPNDEIDLGVTPINQSITKTLKVENIGIVPLEVTNINIDNSVYTYQLTSYKIDPSQSTDLIITLQASLASIARGTISIESDSYPNSKLNYSLYGVVGQGSSVLELSVNDLSNVYSKGKVYDFGTSIKDSPSSVDIFISNKGTTDLIIDSISLPNQFSLGNITFPISINPGQTDRYSLTYSRSQSGYHQGLVTIISNDTNNSPFVLNVLGITRALSALIEVWEGNNEIIDNISIVEYGKTKKDVPVTKLFRTKNVGSGVIYIDSINYPLGYLWNNFQKNLVDNSLLKGQGNTFELIFEAEDLGKYEGEVILGNNDSSKNPFNFFITGLVVEPAIEVWDITNNVEILDEEILDFGDTDINQYIDIELEIRNTGTETLFLNMVITPAMDYRILGVIPNAVLPQGSEKLTIRLIANKEGLILGELVIKSNDPQTPKYNILLRGLVIKPRIQVRTNNKILTDDILYNPIDLGATSVGVQIVKRFEIHNIGTADLDVSDVYESLHASGSSFTITSATTPFTIAPVNIKEFDISLDATIPGDYVTDIGIISNDYDKSPFNFAVIGKVYGPYLKVYRGNQELNNNDTHDFGELFLEETKVLILKIYNNGNIDLNINNFNIKGDFVLSSIFPSRVVAGGMIGIQITALSNVRGINIGSISFESNDYYQPQYELNLLSKTVSPVLALYKGNSIIYRPIDLGIVKYKTLTDLKLNIRNLGDYDLNIKSIFIKSDTFFIHNYPSMTIAPSQSSEFTVRVDSSLVGMNYGTIQILSSDPITPDLNTDIRLEVIVPVAELRDKDSGILSDNSLIDLGELSRGEQGTQLIRVYNKGKDELNLTLSSTNTFNIVYNDPVLPSQQKGINISFNSDIGGYHNETLFITTNDPFNSKFSFSLQSYVKVPRPFVYYQDKLIDTSKTLKMKSQSITKTLEDEISLINEGDDLYRFKIYADDINVIADIRDPIEVEPGAKEDLHIDFSNTSVGLISGNFIIVDHYYGLPDIVIPYEVEIVGSIFTIKYNNNTVTTNSLNIDLGVVPPYSFKEDYILITNEGTDILEVQGIHLAPPFELIEEVPNMLKPGETVRARFTINAYKANGVVNSSFTINSNDINRPSFTINLSADVTELIPEFIWNNTVIEDDSSILVPSKYKKETTSTTLTVNNPFNHPLTIEHIINEDNALVFSIQTPVVIPANSSLDIDISKYLGYTGYFEHPIEIYTDNIYLSPFKFNLVGESLINFDEMPKLKSGNTIPDDPEERTVFVDISTNIMYVYKDDNWQAYFNLNNNTKIRNVVDDSQIGEELLLPTSHSENEWFELEGQMVNKLSYSDLYLQVGSKYGTSKTHFELADLPKLVYKLNNKMVGYYGGTPEMRPDFEVELTWKIKAVDIEE